MTYEEACAEHSWDVPERYNIAADVCDRHPRDKLAMIHEDPDGNVRELRWGELQDMSDRFARVLAERGVQRGDRVAMLLPPTPETAAAFLATWKCGAILLSMSVLYGDDGIKHRLTDSQSAVVVTNGANRSRVAGMAEIVELERSCTTRRARPAWRRASCTPIATSSATTSSSTATTCRTASASMAWASGRGRPASRR